jgi:hypothetical protein
VGETAVTRWMAGQLHMADGSKKETPHPPFGHLLRLLSRHWRVSSLREQLEVPQGERGSCGAIVPHAPTSPLEGEVGVQSNPGEGSS